MQNGEIHAKNVAYGVVLSLNSEGCSIHDLSVPLIRDPEVKKKQKKLVNYCLGEKEFIYIT